MRRIVILGRGGAGKSTFALALGQHLDLPVTELDKHFWRTDFSHPSGEEWRRIQRDLVSADRWILEGDLGPLDDLEVRLQAADSVILLDFPFWTCARRALRRSRERIDFWIWLATWRQKDRPRILDMVGKFAPSAKTIVLKGQRELDALLAAL